MQRRCFGNPPRLLYPGASLARPPYRIWRVKPSRGGEGDQEPHFGHQLPEEMCQEAMRWGYQEVHICEPESQELKHVVHMGEV